MHGKGKARHMTIDKDMVRESINKTKNEKAAGLSGAVLKMAKAPGKAGVHMITDLVNQIMVGVIPAKWDIQNYCKLL